MILELLQQASGHTEDKISVIVPVCNRKKYIGACIDSIVSQTIPLSMLEVIIVDDASTDGTKDIIKEYEAKYPENIMLIECQESSMGLAGKVRNIGLGYASGQYISFLDSEDKIEPDFLQKLYMKAVLYRADYVGCAGVIVGKEGVLEELSKTERFYEANKIIDRKLLLSEEGTTDDICGKLYSREFLLLNNLFFSEEKGCFDKVVFHSEVLRCVNRVYSLSDSLYSVTLDEDQLLNIDKVYEYIKDYLETQIEALEILKEDGLLKQELERCFYDAVYTIRRMCDCNQKLELFYQYLPYIKEKIREKFPYLEQNNYIYLKKTKANLNLMNELFEDNDYFDESKKIYILAPAGGRSGGPELLHQFCNALNNQGVDAKMVYFGADGSFEKVPCHDAYIKYNTSSEDNIRVIDRANNIVIIPEEAVVLSKLFEKAKPVIWWLSVDNYLESFFVIDNLKKGGNIDPLDFEYNNKYMHMVQSKYAYYFLVEQFNISAEKIVYLSDYINDSFFAEVESEKENMVMYNPKKGYEDLRCIIEKATDIKFVPIQNMTADEVYGNLCKAKVYIDLGKFPGKDRIPREAAMSGCCVITNKKGAAAYKEDVPIAEKYKFEHPLENEDKIIKLIRMVFENYDKYAGEFDKYREIIREEKAWFLRDTKHFIKVMLEKNT